MLDITHFPLENFMHRNRIFDEDCLNEVARIMAQGALRIISKKANRAATPSLAAERNLRLISGERFDAAAS